MKGTRIILYNIRHEGLRDCVTCRNNMDVNKLDALTTKVRSLTRVTCIVQYTLFYIYWSASLLMNHILHVRF